MEPAAVEWRSGSAFADAEGHGSRLTVLCFQNVAGLSEHGWNVDDESGSVQATTKTSPARIPASALRVRKTGSGHLRPRKSKVFSAMVSCRKGRKNRGRSLS